MAVNMQDHRTQLLLLQLLLLLLLLWYLRIFTRSSSSSTIQLHRGRRSTAAASFSDLASP
jgi:hypothetical protein